MKKIIFLISLLCTQAYAQKSIVSISPGDNESTIINKAAHVTPSPRQLRWQMLELTAFFHFGINTFTDREWGDGKEDISIFNPAQLDAEQWVKAIKKAGFKQAIITAKHHDGFCLWPSKFTAHSIKNTPYKQGKGDIVKEVADACRKYNIGFGVYLSPWDRNNASYGTDAYNTYFVNQLTELLTQYGKVDEVWFDGANGEGPNGKKQVYDFNSWYTLIRKLQPQAVIAVQGPMYAG
ncbi:alpha-L-fucosidase [Pedobacter riviphilus]|uniref:alpha-L-fucosidase n=1 Tax=Pedobacter riviphilus TaxID=2766984 RepID=UPI002103ABB7|nr:alpha-L-fucosidase [Pedobacter riviphilus]